MPRKKTTKQEYKQTFKMNAVALVRRSGRSAVSVAQQLNIQPWKLRNWISEANERSERIAEMDEVSQLREENKRLKEDLDFLKKSSGVLCEKPAVKYAYMRDLHAPLAVERMCALLDVSRGGYHKFLKREPSARALRHEDLLKYIRKAFRESRCTYGVRRVHKALVRTGVQCNRKTVAALMQRNGIAPKRRRKFKSTTDSRHKIPVSKNLLNREFSGV